NVNETSNDLTKDAAMTNMESVSSLEQLRGKALAEPGLTHEDSLAIQTIFAERSIAKDLDEDMEILSLKGDLGKASFGDAKTLAQYDSLMRANHSLTRRFFHPFAKKFFEFKEQKVPTKDIAKGFTVVFMQMLPKALFLYLPFLAFVLWIFNNKKKWWFFDHGVFTLHYFSFLLIILMVFSI